MGSGDEIGIYDGDLLVGVFTLDQICTPENQFDNDLIAFSVLLMGMDINREMLYNGSLG